MFSESQIRLHIEKNPSIKNEIKSIGWEEREFITQCSDYSKKVSFKDIDLFIKQTIKVLRSQPIVANQVNDVTRDAHFEVLNKKYAKRDAKTEERNTLSSLTKRLSNLWKGGKTRKHKKHKKKSKSTRRCRH